MGPLIPLIPVLGLFAGAIIAKLAHEELKDGRPYFILSQHVLLASIVGIMIWNIPGIIISVLFFLALWKMRFNHPLRLMPVFAVPAMFNPISQIPIFLYFIPTATLHHNKPKKLFLISIIYVIVSIASYFLPTVLQK